MLTDDFIQKNRKNYYFNNYGNLITQQNSGQKIYDNVKNGYAVIDSFNNVIVSISKLKELVEKASFNARKMNPDVSAPFRINNTEDCSKSYW